MSGYDKKSAAVLAAVIALSGASAQADTFIGGGIRAYMTQECNPDSASITSRVEPARLGYRPGQSNGGISTFTADFSDGAQQVWVERRLVESATRFRARGVEVWMGYPDDPVPRPRLRPAHLRIVEPAGETDINLARQIFIRFQITNYWGVPGCSATFVGVLANESTSEYVTPASDRSGLAASAGDLPAPDFGFIDTEPMLRSRGAPDF